MTNPKWEATKQKYNIAGLKILMTTYHQKTKLQAHDYVDDCDWEEELADGIININQEFYENTNNIPNLDYDAIEYIYTGGIFNRILINFNGCMLHSSAVVVDGYAYLFSADSGTGKSTHTQLWLKHFGDRAFIINDDKPVIRCIDDEWYVFGTPWSGKTNQNKNVRARLGAIVFLERSEENWIDDISLKEALPKFFKQTVRRLQKEDKMDMVLSTMEKVLSQTPIYKMGCNISDNAVVTAYEKIRRV